MVRKRTSGVRRAYATSPHDTRSSTAALSVSERPTARAPDAARPRASLWWGAGGLHARLSLLPQVLINHFMSPLASILGLRGAGQHRCCARQHRACAVQAL